MEMSGPSSVAQGVTGKRASGRVVRKPVRLENSIIGHDSAKRKRALNDDAAGENEDESELDTSSTGGSDGEPDEEEVREVRRRSQSKNTGNKSTAKKPRMSNGANNTTLAIRSANIQSKLAPNASKTQKARSRSVQVPEEGLYADLFERGKNCEEVASEWAHSLRRDNVAAIRDFVNFILKCIGCDNKVESYDIEDLDNVPAKLSDILTEYQHGHNAEYPLISKSKQYAGFRTILIDFCNAAVKSLHASSKLYEEPEIFDNIQTWAATMSGAPLRPFRHTATIVSLTMSTALCEIARDLQTSVANARTQIESEKKKKRVNEGRVGTIQKSLDADELKLLVIDALLKDGFDTVFVHRYRDVEEKIRVDCVNALGTWTVTYRKLFLDGVFLRYLGWVLSDTNLQTRLEVIKQLKPLFKNQRNVAALRAFTDRFRPRLIEMGTRDADTGVRAETIELLDRLRNAELLEPDDIDTVGRLIFDVEPRVRKAVAKFFVSNIEDLFQASIEEIDVDQFEDVLPKTQDSGDYINPCQSWIKFKCLAQTLTGYNDEDEPVGGSEIPTELPTAEDIDTRYALATHAIFPHMAELQEWESLAGYLLYDHSQITAAPDSANVALAVQASYKLSAGEETVLLEVLHCAVKLYLQQLGPSQSDISRKGKKSRSNKDGLQAKREVVALHLTLIIPQLLNKFGSAPQAAASILRLEQLLDINLVDDLQQGEGSYSSLLDDINKQFVSHSDRHVLVEASKSLRTARSYEQAQEATDAKVRDIWLDASNTLQTLLRDQNIDTRATLPRNVLTEVVNTVTRLSNLATISDCTSILESKTQQPSASAKKKAGLSLFDILLQLAKRGVSDEKATPAVAELEDELSSSAIRTISFYFMWRVRSIRDLLISNDIKHLTTGMLVALSMNRVSFVETLSRIISSRNAMDMVKLQAVMAILDVFTLLTTLQHVKPSKGSQFPEELVANLKSLMTEIPSTLQVAIMQTHERLVVVFAKRTRRKIEKVKAAEDPTKDDAPPIDSDDEDAESIEGEDEEAGGEEGAGKEARKRAALVAEQRLCELTSKIVLAIIARIMDRKVKERLMVNKTKLGKNYGQVLGYLEDKKAAKSKKQSGGGKGREGKEKGRKAGVAGAAATTAAKEMTSKKRRAAPIDLEDVADPIEDSDDDENENEDGGDEEEALQEEDYAEERRRRSAMTRTRARGDGDGDGGAVDMAEYEDDDEIMGD